MNPLVPIAHTHPFNWPEGKRCGVCLSFDDARRSAIDVGVPLFGRFGVKATFYVVSRNVEKRHDAWRAAAERGHEMGNHTLTHPCTGNFGFIQRRGNALEQYTLEQMEQELLDANEQIEQLLDVQPRTFAYPCYSTFVGRGVERRSYVPLVARYFEIGRVGKDESAADPSICDLAAVPSITSDDRTWEHLHAAVEQAASENSWLILTGHEIGEEGRQTTSANALEKLCTYCTDPANGIWIDTVANIGAYVREQQAALTA